MRILSQLLGIYSELQKPLIIFRLPDKDTTFFRLSDIQETFSLPSLCFTETDFTNCYRDHEDTYLNAAVLTDLARYYNRPLLAQLSQFNPDNPNEGPILFLFPDFKRAPKEEHVWESVQLPLENLQDILEVKLEPASPPTVQLLESRNAMALDKVLGRPSESSNKRQKISSTEDRPQSLSAITNNIQPTHPSRKIQSYPPIHEDNEEDDRRLKHKNALNLTIFAPSYTEQLAGIKSAPIHSNFNQIKQQQQQQQPQNKPSQVQQQHLMPASATVARPPFLVSPRRHEFAIPPIVPSQQQPPNSANPTSRESYIYKKPPPQIAMTAASAPLPPKTPTTSSFAALQKQQYLQPFEHLFDTIETTRTLKTTLDDQIRRSSSLIQTLQASATTIEGLIRNQVKEAQIDLLQQYEKTMEGLTQRIQVLEQHVFNTQQKSKETNNLQQPPTIIRSQNDIGPQEYHSMLDALKDRLDRLEKQIEI